MSMLVSHLELGSLFRDTYHCGRRLRVLDQYQEDIASNRKRRASSSRDGEPKRDLLPGLVRKEDRACLPKPDERGIDLVYVQLGRFDRR